MILLTAICIQQTTYLNADWCSSEIDTLRKHVDEIHTVLIGDQEVTPKQMYIHIAQVQDFMRKLGIPRGFEQGTVSRKMNLGAFDVPFIKIGLDRYFKDEDILEWIEKQKNG